MGGPAGARRKRRAGLTTVEYALMLFFFVVTSIFGFPALVETAGRFVGAAGDGIVQAAEADPATGVTP